MPETADSVIVQLDANLGDYSAKVNQGANAFDQSMKRMQTSASQTESHVGRAFGNTRIAQMELQHVVTASSDAFAAGIPIQRIFASEMGRIAEAVTLAGGSMGKFGAFLGGPWGIALQVGIGLMAALVSAHEKAGAGASEHKDNEEKLSEALSHQKVSTDALLDSITKLRQAEDKSLQTENALIDSRARLAEKTLDVARANKAVLESQLGAAVKTQAEAQQHVATAVGRPAMLAAGEEMKGANNEVDRLKTEIANLNDTIVQAQATLADEGTKAARLLSSHVGRVKAEYDALQRQLEIKYRGGNINGQQVQGLFNQPGLTTQARLRLVQQEAAEEDKLRIARERQTQAAQKLDGAEEGKTQRERAGDADNTSFQMPVHGTVTGRFSDPRAASMGVSAHAHKGVDIAVPVGTDVEAAAGGTVIEAGTMPGYGNVIIIDHGRGTTTRYAHLSKFLASKGDVVEQGQVIALSGGARGAPGSGDATGPHLHYEVRRDGRAVDPTKGVFPTDTVASQHDAERLAAAAKAQALKAAESQDAFNRAKDRANDDLLKAQDALKVGLDDQLAAQITEIDAEKKRRDDAIEAEATAKGWNDLQKKQLLALNDTWAIQMRHNAIAREGEKLADQQLSSQKSALENARTLEELSSRLALTNAERKASALRLLELSQEEERLTQMRIRDGALSTPAQKAQAQGRLDLLDQQRAGQVELINREFASPGQKMLMDLQTQSAELDQAFQRVAVDGLDSLNKGIVDAITGAKSLGAAFHDVAGQIIADLLRIAIQETIIKPIAEKLFGKNGSGGSDIFSALAHLFGGGGFKPDSFVANPVQSLGSGPGLDGIDIPLPGRAAGGPVVPGKLYRVNETGVEGFMPAGSGTIIPLGQMKGAQGGGTTVIQPIQFDLRGAVMTEDILAQMNALADQAAMRGAVGGMSLTRRQLARAAAQRLA